ncbi:hypothetical protein M9Y10_007278 [Tritrichomonas musculus]|uniref:Uncharacterized protein n=1 Tax=Tritrichomonas musculus TaxID=1915356 RepID=A0ABR2J0Y0_9EUKA
MKDAVTYYKTAAENGNVESMYMYANLTFYGENTPVNKTEAAYYFKKAADNGHAMAMCTYAILREKGDGMPADFGEAKEYYNMAEKKKKGIVKNENIHPPNCNRFNSYPSESLISTSSYR